MTEIERVLEELFKPHGFTEVCPTWYMGIKTHHSQYIHPNKNKIIFITENKVTLRQWDHEHNWWSDIFIELCDPNSLQIIEDWAKTP